MNTLSYPKRENSQAGERGSGTGLALGIIAVLLVFFSVLAGLIAAVTANHRASTAADLAALAAADSARGLTLGEPCQVANETAANNGAMLIACARSPTREGTVDVRVQVEISGPYAFLGPAESLARAGPPGA